VSISR
jgi:hypothetical protein